MKGTIINLCLIILAVALVLLSRWYVEDVKGISLYTGYNVSLISLASGLLSGVTYYLIISISVFIGILLKRRRIQKKDWFIPLSIFGFVLSAYGMEKVENIILFKPFTMTKIYVGITICSVLLLLLAHVINKKRGFIEVPKKGKRKKNK